MLYEIHNSFDSNLCAIGYNQDWSFPLHSHRGFELIMVTEGEMEIAVDKHCYVLKENEAVLVFPNQIHSLKNIHKSADIFCTFSKDLVNHFSKTRQNYLPKDNFFKVDPQWAQLLRQLHAEDSIYMIKSILYRLVAEFDKHAEYVELQGTSTDALVYQIFQYVEKNYSQDCTLISLSSHLKYNREYLSRVFKNYCNISYNDYVNHCRIEEACRMLHTRKASIATISMDCGYSSIRSFNRNFKKIMGMTPQEYVNVS